jgi:DNA-binding NarL/FixJ family response regulator
MGAYRIVLADDHAMFRQGIKRIVEEMEGLVVVGETGDGVTLLKLLNKIQADMVIMDISMPSMRGIEATKEITSLYPDIKILILTMHRDMAYFEHAISAGATGFLLKEDADVELVNAIKTIRNGKVYLSPLLTEALTGKVFRSGSAGGEKPEELLTTREREVLKLIAEGKTSKEIADLFNISTRTVQHHRANMMHKLEINKTAELIKYAIRKGYTTLNNDV